MTSEESNKGSRNSEKITGRLNFGIEADIVFEQNVPIHLNVAEHIHIYFRLFFVYTLLAVLSCFLPVGIFKSQ